MAIKALKNLNFKQLLNLIEVSFVPQLKDDLKLPMTKLKLPYSYLHCHSKAASLPSHVFNAV